MIYPSRLQNYFLYGVTMWCLVSFKVVLTGVSGGDGGIRIDDVLILLAAAVLLVRGEFRRVKVSRPLRFYLICTMTGVVSACWNGIVTGRVPFFYSLISAVRLSSISSFIILDISLREQVQSDPLPNGISLDSAYCDSSADGEHYTHREWLLTGEGDRKHERSI